MTKAGVLLLLAVHCAADIFVYDSEELRHSYVRARVNTMFSLADTPAGSQQPSIKVHLQFSGVAGKDPNTPLARPEVVIYQSSSRDFTDDIGWVPANATGDVQRVFCCSAPWVDKIQGCKQANLGTLLLNPAIVNPWRARYDVQNQSIRMPSDRKSGYNVTTTGRHTLVVANCDNWGDLAVSGKVVWRNPFGYLPGQLYGYLPFYSLMSGIYICVAAIWFLFNLCYWQEVVTLQNAISAVLSLCLIEMATWYFDYVNYNQTGYRHVGPFVIGMLTSVVRRAVSRMLVISVSLGYGVVKLVLGEDRNRIFVLGGLYFVFGALLELVVHYGQTNEVKSKWKLLLTLPVAALDSYAYWWSFIALYQVITALKMKNQKTKLGLYHRFLVVLLVCLVAAVGFAGYQMWYMSTAQFEVDYKNYWILENGFWQILYSFVLFCIMFLWLPSKNSRRFAYAELGQNDDDDEMDEFVSDDFKNGETSKRSKSKTADETEPVFEIGVADDDDEHDDLVDPNVLPKMN